MEHYSGRMMSAEYELLSQKRMEQIRRMYPINDSKGHYFVSLIKSKMTDMLLTILFMIKSVS